MKKKKTFFFPIFSSSVFRRGTCFLLDGFFISFTVFGIIPFPLRSFILIIYFYFAENNEISCQFLTSWMKKMSTMLARFLVKFAVALTVRNKVRVYFKQQPSLLNVFDFYYMLFRPNAKLQNSHEIPVEIDCFVKQINCPSCKFVFR